MKKVFLFILILLWAIPASAEEINYYFGVDDYFGYAVSLPSEYPVIYHGVNDATASLFYDLNAKEAEEWLNIADADIMFLIPDANLVVELRMLRYMFDEFMPFNTREQVRTYGDYWTEAFSELGYQVQFSTIFTGDNNIMAKTAYSINSEGILYNYLEYNSIFGKDAFYATCSSLQSELSPYYVYKIESILDTVRVVFSGYSK